MFPKPGSSSLRFLHLACRNVSLRHKFIPTTRRHEGYVVSCLRDFHLTASSFGVTPINMPSLSPTMTEGTIVKWLKQEGDKIAPGDVICEIQTDKAVVSLEYDEEGILAKLLKPDNSSDVKIGTPIALVVDEGDDWKNVEIPKDLDLDTSVSVTKPAASQSQPQSLPVPAISAPSGIGLIGPAVRNLLLQYGLNPSQIPASGAHGNLLKGDILRQVVEQKSQPKSQGTLSKPHTWSAKGSPPSSATFIELEITSMRRTIAKRLLQSKSSIPHAYATADCRINGIASLRKRMQAAGLKVSINDFVIKGVADALGKVPAVNVVWEGSELKQMGRVDISVAVATGSGLITPIVTDVAGKNILQISEDVGQLAVKAKSGKLQPHEFLGGTFTISNLGMFGIHHFSAIINPPQCAILAVGGSHNYIGENGELENRITLTLSYDATGISEETALMFLAHLKHELENSSETSMGIFNIESRLEIIELSRTLV